MSEQIFETLGYDQNDEIAERLGQLVRATNDEGKIWEGIGQTHFRLALGEQGQYLVRSGETVVTVSSDGRNIDFTGKTPEAELPVTREDQATMVVLGALASHPLLRDVPHSQTAEFSKLPITERIWLVASEIDQMAPPQAATQSPRTVGFIYYDVTGSRETHYRLSYHSDIDSRVYPVIERGKGTHRTKQLYTYERYALTIAGLVAYRTVMQPGPNADHYSSNHLQPMHDLLFEMRDRALDIGWYRNPK